jgi:hypothetical protein
MVGIMAVVVQLEVVGSLRGVASVEICNYRRVSGQASVE